MKDCLVFGPCVLIYEPLGPYGILSNFASTPIEIEGETWLTVEHYFQGQKFIEDPYRERIRRCLTAQGCKQLAWGELNDVVRTDWDDIRTTVMQLALEAKYEQSPLFRETLNATWPMPIIENSPVDNYWGIGPGGVGVNMLGRILTNVRNAKLALPESYQPDAASIPPGTGGHSVVFWIPIVQLERSAVSLQCVLYRSLDSSKISGRLTQISLDKQMYTEAVAYFSGTRKSSDDADSSLSSLEAWIAQLVAEPSVHDEPSAQYLFDRIRPIVMDMKYAEYSLNEDARSLLPNWRDSFFDVLVKHVDSDLSEQKIIAVGAGAANESGEIWSVLGDHVTLVDIGSRLVENCRAGAPSATVVQAAAENLSALRSQSFDVYCSLRTYQSLFFDIDRAVAEAYRVLRPGGTAIISVSNAYLGEGCSIIKGQIDSNGMLNLEKPWKDLIKIGNSMNTHGFVTLRMEDLTTELVVIANRS